MTENPLLTDAVPQLAGAMETALFAQGEAHLAAQVAELRISAVCRCDQPYCASFWTDRLPMRRWFMRGRQIELGPDLPGQVTVDVVRGRIAYVEVLPFLGGGTRARPCLGCRERPLALAG